MEAVKDEKVSTLVCAPFKNHCKPMMFYLHIVFCCVSVDQLGCIKS